MKPTVDAEFAALIPPLTEDEYKQLEENLLADGCRDALVVWGNILLDGHNRLKICTEHEIPYTTVERACEDRDDAMRYIIENQFGRRNLTLGNRSMLALKLEPLYKARVKQNMRLSPGRGKKGMEIFPYLFPGTTTRDELAKIAGVSSRTIEKVKKVADEGSPEQVERIKKGGKGNSVTAVYREVRAARPLSVATSPTPDPKPASAEKPLPAVMKPAPSKKPPPTPKADTDAVSAPATPKDDLALIRKQIADLKNPDLDRSGTTEMFVAEYAAFSERTVRSLGSFTGEPYDAMYPLLKSRERKKLAELNNSIIKAVQKNILLCGGA